MKLDDVVIKLYNKYSERKVIPKQLVNDFESIVLKELNEKMSEAKRYYEKRKEKNKKIEKIVEDEISKINKDLKEVDFNYKLIRMSSYPYFNLVEDSDVDYGLMIKNNNPVKTFRATLILIKNEYIPFKITCSKAKPESYTLRFSKKVKNVEIEIKIRDYDGSKSIVKLHEKMDKSDRNKQMLITYGKKIMRKNNKAYMALKGLIYNYYFYGVKDNYFMSGW